MRSKAQVKYVGIQVGLEYFSLNSKIVCICKFKNVTVPVPHIAHKLKKMVKVSSYELKMWCSIRYHHITSRF